MQLTACVNTSLKANGNGLSTENDEVRMPDSLTHEQVLKLAERECGVMLAGDPAMEEIARRIYSFRNSGLVHTLVGSPGTGKEGLANLVYKVSRQGGDFHPVNIAGLSEQLLESELFGHEKGAYSGALTARLGRFGEIQVKGTLFLDEVGELPFSTQAKILRAVSEEPKFTVVGTNKELSIQGRIVCATNVDLDEAVRTNKMRRDLRERLDACLFVIPPFAKRSPLHQKKVIEYILNRFRIKSRTQDLELADNAKELLLESPPPGNVRGIKNAIERAGYMAQGNGLAVIDADLLRTEMQKKTSSDDHDKESVQRPAHEIQIGSRTVDLSGPNVYLNAEYAVISAVLEFNNDNQSEASRILGIGRGAIRHKIKTYESIQEEV